MALSYPYILTATEAVLASLYTFDVPKAHTSTEIPNGGLESRGMQLPKSSPGGYGG